MGAIDIGDLVVVQVTVETVTVYNVVTVETIVSYSNTLTTVRTKLCIDIPSINIKAAWLDLRKP